MSHNPGTGYKGFRSWSSQECPTLKPGETKESRSTKFGAMAKSMIAPESSTPVAVGNQRFDSISKSNFDHVKNHKYKIPDRRGCMAAADKRELSSNSVKFLGQSMYESDFSSQNYELTKMLEISQDQWRLTFGNLAGRSEVITASQIKHLLRDILGKTPSQSLLNTFLSQGDMSEDRNYDKEFSLEHFMHVKHEAIQFMKKSSVSSSREIPGWIRQEAKISVMKNAAPVSSHAIDYGKYGDRPMDRPHMKKSGMASTTTDLNTGTATDTYHIPGYGGFIPQAGNNPAANKHGNGETLKSRHGDLRLYHDDNIPGYTGHRPGNCMNYRGESKTGRDTLTTNGTTFIPLTNRAQNSSTI